MTAGEWKLLHTPILRCNPSLAKSSRRQAGLPLLKPCSEVVTRLEAQGSSGKLKLPLTIHFSGPDLHAYLLGKWTVCTVVGMKAPNRPYWSPGWPSMGGQWHLLHLKPLQPLKVLQRSWYEELGPLPGNTQHPCPFSPEDIMKRFTYSVAPA